MKPNDDDEHSCRNVTCKDHSQRFKTHWNT